MINWTLEEESILQIYDRGSRLSTLSAIEEVLPYALDDPAMHRIMSRTVEKLEQTSDMDYMLMMLESDPLWEDEYDEDCDSYAS